LRMTDSLSLDLDSGDIHLTSLWEKDEDDFWNDDF